MLKFKNPKKELPKEDQTVLVKFKDKSKANYYVCIYTKNIHDQLSFVEAWFEGYYWFDVNEIVGWLPIEHLDGIQTEEG